MADFDPSDRTPPLQAPAAQLSADEIAEMRRQCVQPDPAEIDRIAACIAATESIPDKFWNVKSWAEQSDERVRANAADAGYDDVPEVYWENREYNREQVATWRRYAFDAVVQARSGVPRLIDAVEALTAENARLTNSLEMRRIEKGVMDKGLENACATINVLRSEIALLRGEKHDLRDERDRLKTEVARLTANMATARTLVDRGAVRAWNDTHYRTEPLSADRKRVIETHDMFRQALTLLNPDASETEAAMQELADLGQAMQPDCYATSIDMALLSDLCREEPDEATKREVASMMDKLNGGS